MVGMTNSNSREKYLSLVYSVKAAINLPSKLEYLRRLKQALLDEENALLISEIIPCFFDLFSDSFAPVRKFATEYALLILWLNFAWLTDIFIELSICCYLLILGLLVKLD